MPSNPPCSAVFASFRFLFRPLRTSNSLEMMQCNADAMAKRIFSFFQRKEQSRIDGLRKGLVGWLAWPRYDGFTQKFKGNERESIWLE